MNRPRQYDNVLIGLCLVLLVIMFGFLVVMQTWSVQ